ncbi:MAG: TolC family outer membrane protein [Alphaproteobacteria bacterium]|nr:TolC family outer membrane protein [Alphaproteobacteria bacterium]
MTLQQAWVDAYTNNPSLESERAKLRATDEQVAQALSNWRPTVEGTTSAGRSWEHTHQQSVSAASEFAKNGDSYGVQVTQPVFRGFRTIEQTEAAKEQVMAERAQLENVEQQVFLQVAKAYLDYLRDAEILTLQKDNKRVLKEKLDETTIRAKVGELTQTDLQQARSRLARAEVGALQAENSLESDRAAFVHAVGYEPEKLKEPKLALDPQADIETTLHKSETVNPSVVAAQYAVDEAKSEIAINKGALAPEINIVGNAEHDYGQNVSFPGNTNNSSIMVQLKMPLYSGGADYSKIRAARQTATQRRMDLEEQRHKSRETAYNAWQQLRVSEQAIKADELQIEAAQKALEGVRVEAKVGTRTTLDVLNAEQEKLDALVDMAKSRHDKNDAILQIKAAVGALTADAMQLPLKPYDPKQYYDNNTGKLIGFGDDDDYVVGKINKLHPEE